LFFGFSTKIILLSSINFLAAALAGQNHYQILTTPVELLKSLVQLYEKIKHT